MIYFLVHLLVFFFVFFFIGFQLLCWNFIILSFQNGMRPYWSLSHGKYIRLGVEGFSSSISPDLRLNSPQLAQVRIYGICLCLAILLHFVFGYVFLLNIIVGWLGEPLYLFNVVVLMISCAGISLLLVAPLFFMLQVALRRKLGKDELVFAPSAHTVHFLTVGLVMISIFEVCRMFLGLSFLSSPVAINLLFVSFSLSIIGLTTLAVMFSFRNMSFRVPLSNIEPDEFYANLRFLQRKQFNESDLSAMTDLEIQSVIEIAKYVGYKSKADLASRVLLDRMGKIESEKSVDD